MNPEALNQSLESGQVTFFSRWRQTLWTKGETSGNFLALVEAIPDCDGDCLLVQARPAGPVCHLGTATCFSSDEPTHTDLAFLAELERIIERCDIDRPEGSYTTRLLEEGDSKARFVKEAVDAVKEECRQGAMTVSAVYRFFATEPDGERLHLYLPDSDQAAGTLTFRRQPKGDGRCLTDYVRGPLADGRRDTICLMATTAGAGIRDLATLYRDEGAYLKSHVLQALALESAEASMEWLHAQVRGWWGSPDAQGTPREDLFKAKYKGKRYSFGYPA